MNKPEGLKNEGRYPYTYAADYLRVKFQEISGESFLMSRADASQLRSVFANTLGVSDVELACNLADKFITEYGE